MGQEESCERWECHVEGAGRLAMVERKTEQIRKRLSAEDSCASTVDCRYLIKDMTLLYIPMKHTISLDHAMLCWIDVCRR